MKLLLTSNGIANKSIAKALRELLGKDFSKTSIAFIPTAANSKTIDHEDKQWLINDLTNLKNLGFKHFDIINLELIKKEQLTKRLAKIDLIAVGGGDTFYLMHWMEKSGLKDLIPALLKKKVYMGISAGSIATNRKLNTPSNELEKMYYENAKPSNQKGLGLVDFHFRPHLNSKDFPLITKKMLDQIALKLDTPLYCLDDQMVLKVINKKIEIVGEGKYLEYKK